MWQPNSLMRFSSPARSMVFSQLAMASAVSSPMPRTWSSWRLEALRMAGASPKCSSNCRTRTGPTCSIMFSATNASRESIMVGYSITPSRRKPIAEFAMAYQVFRGFLSDGHVQNRDRIHLILIQAFPGTVCPNRFRQAKRLKQWLACPMLKTCPEEIGNTDGWPMGMSLRTSHLKQL